MSTIFPPFTLPQVKSLPCTILLYFTPLPWVARGLNGVIIQILVPEPTFFQWIRSRNMKTAPRLYSKM